MNLPFQQTYFVAMFQASTSSVDEVRSRYHQAIADHVNRSREFQKRRLLVMAGAFDNGTGETVSTMGVMTTREAAEEFVRGDPVGLNGMVISGSIKPWVNMLQEV